MIGQSRCPPFIYPMIRSFFVSLYSNLSFAGKPDGNGLLLLLSCCFHKYSLCKTGAETSNRRCIPIRDLLSVSIHNASIITANDGNARFSAKTLPKPYEKRTSAAVTDVLCCYCFILWCQSSRKTCSRVSASVLRTWMSDIISHQRATTGLSSWYFWAKAAPCSHS